MAEILAALHKGSAAAASPFALSLIAGDRARSPISAFHRWWSERCQVKQFSVTQVPFGDLAGWHFERESGNLAHDSGGFFSVEGINYRSGSAGGRSQPIIHQPEIGILGILVKEFDGVLHCLMQAKMEPGNVNTLQLSPTVQATRSNYTQVHQGSRTRYVEYFRTPTPGRVLVDVLQSEQGVWFWHKRNRNMVVQVTEDVAEHEHFYWLTLQQIYELMRIDNLINMDARTVLACMAMAPPEAQPRDPADPFAAALGHSYRPDAAALHTQTEILSWFTECKTRCDWSARRLPLAEVPGWSLTPDELVDDDASRFRVIGVRVRAGNREVTQWSQPLLAPRGHGLAAFLTKRIDGVLHMLVQARYEPGLLDRVEIAPTVQLPVVEGAGPEDGGPVPFADVLAAADRSRLRYDTLMSEEGGRFHHAQTRYQVIEADADFPEEVPDGYCWVTIHQLMRLVKHSHYLNIEARSLLACVHSLW
ncbi:NDP-hexose 2,3-dehydratase family protein [Streptomyces sp. NPDC048516]|uniref:NDP-hexose 2,3-dehydratase family protein n=1 Tax=Streptomyces sp. NPDC048516 TaxID=3365565 RepID=UPI00371D5A6A